jgi:hypothetical protein
LIGIAAVIAASLFVGMAGFQVTLALGAPLGQHVLGGRNAGVLPGRLRVTSALAAAILAGAAAIVLARSGVIGWPADVVALLAPASWIIAGYMVLNTLANLRSTSRLERTVFASMTLTLAILCAYVALG